MKTVTIIPQVLEGGKYNIFLNFYYQKHFHEKQSIFITICRKGVDLIDSKSCDDSYAKLHETLTPHFHLFLNYISSNLQDKNIYLIIVEDFARSFLKMVEDVDKGNISFQETFANLKHKINIKLLLSPDRAVTSLDYAKRLISHLPKCYPIKFYVDGTDNKYYLEELNNALPTLEFVDITGFHKECYILKPIILYFNNQLTGIYNHLVIKPILEKMD